MEFLAWIQDTLPAVWVRESLWGYPAVLSSHAVGMAAVVGTVLMIDLRVLGYGRRIPITAFNRLFTVARVGVVLNVCSGILLFIADAERFAANPAFQIKMGLIVAGAIAAWLLMGAVMGKREAGVEARRAKVTAALSMVFWLGTIVAGRLTAYI